MKKIINKIKDFVNNKKMVDRINDNMSITIHINNDDNVPEDFNYDRSIHTFTLSKKEAYLAQEFVKEHMNCCRENPTAIGGSIDYIFTPTSIADGISIRCNLCDEEKNITDYDLW